MLLYSDKGTQFGGFDVEVNVKVIILRGTWPRNYKSTGKLSYA